MSRHSNFTPDEIKREREKHEAFLRRASSYRHYFISRRDFVVSGAMTRNEACLVSDLINLETIPTAIRDEDGFMLCTFKYLEWSYAWSRRNQRTILSTLASKGFITIKKKGSPPKRWIKLDLLAIENAVDEAFSSLGTNYSEHLMNEQLASTMDDEDDSEDSEIPRDFSKRAGSAHSKGPKRPIQKGRFGPSALLRIKTLRINVDGPERPSTAHTHEISSFHDDSIPRQSKKEPRHQDEQVREWSKRLREAYHGLGFIAAKFQKNVMKDLVTLRDEDHVPEEEIERIITWLETKPKQDLIRGKLRSTSLGQFYNHFSWIQGIYHSLRNTETCDDEASIQELIERDAAIHYQPPIETEEQREIISDEEWDEIVKKEEAKQAGKKRKSR